MAKKDDRPLLRQALRGTALVTLLAASVCAVALAMAFVFVVVMT